MESIEVRTYLLLVKHAYDKKKEAELAENSIWRLGVGISAEQVRESGISTVQVRLAC